MKKVIKFEAQDGSIFDSEEACVEYEKRKAMINRIYQEIRHSDSEEIYDWIVTNTKGFKD